jgi:hypothetical protein
VFGIADPRHAVAGLLANDPADFFEQAPLVRGAQEDLVAVADRPQFAIQPTQGFCGFIALLGGSLKELNQSPDGEIEQRGGHEDKDRPLYRIHSRGQIEMSYDLVTERDPETRDHSVAQCNSTWTQA